MFAGLGFSRWFSFAAKLPGAKRNRLQAKYSFNYRNQDRIEYYNDLNAFRSIGDFIALVDTNNSLSVQEFPAFQPISPLEIPFSVRESDLIRRKGTPRFVTERGIISRRQRILFYRDHLDGFEFITQFHFIGGVLMIVKQDISHANYERSKKLLDLIKQKYALAIPDQSWKEHTPVRITDPVGCCVLLRHGYKTELTYSNISQEFSALLLREDQITKETKVQIERITERRIMVKI